jgi:hypothetical protein
LLITAWHRIATNGWLLATWLIEQGVAPPLIDASLVAASLASFGVNWHASLCLFVALALALVKHYTTWAPVPLIELLALAEQTATGRHCNVAQSILPLLCCLTRIIT